MPEAEHSTDRTTPSRRLLCRGGLVALPAVMAVLGLAAWIAVPVADRAGGQLGATSLAGVVAVQGIAGVLVTLGLAIAYGRECCRSDAFLARECTLASDRARLATVLRATRDAVIVTDRYGIVRDLNSNAESTFGYARPDTIGRSYIDLIVPERDQPFHASLLRQYRETGRTVLADSGKREGVVQTRDGREIPVEISVSLDAMGGDPVFVTFVRDLTERHRREAGLRRALDAAETARAEAERMQADVEADLTACLRGMKAAMPGGAAAADEGSQELDLAGLGVGIAALEDLAGGRTAGDGVASCRPAALAQEVLRQFSALSRRSGNRLDLALDGLDATTELAIDGQALRRLLVDLVDRTIDANRDAAVTLHLSLAPRVQPILSVAILAPRVGRGEADRPPSLEGSFRNFEELGGRARLEFRCILPGTVPRPDVPDDGGQAIPAADEGKQVA